MVEEDAVGGVHAVRLAVVDHDPVRVLLRHTVRGPGIEGGLLGLRDLPDLAVQFRRGRLVEPRKVREAARADGVQQAQRAHAVHLRRVLGHLERHLREGCTAGDGAKGRGEGQVHVKKGTTAEVGGGFQLTATWDMAPKL